MARWNDERLGMLAEGIRLCFSRWTALQLAVENEWGGRNSVQKSQQLVEDVVSFLTQTKGTLYIDDLEALLEDAMSESFNTDLEDGSHEEVAEIVMFLNEECGVGNFERVKSMALSANPSSGAQKKSICKDTEESNDDESGEVAELSSTSNLEKEPASIPETMDIDKSNETEAPEDDWTVVQSRRSRRGGKRPA
ncbi:pre-rRNA-processing protein TSR2 homolog [Selaginella moellendorffii]|nr:pre-rRNA-processing protein TSR2 homolog [Selaginella moellendorffii]|eukprot:XP_002983095.2 pre-rRNA-processing protein TSR2 homolog [Selaginella moellendorffii]